MFQENAIVERSQPCPTVRTMRSYHEDFRDDHVSYNINVTCIVMLLHYLCTVVVIVIIAFHSRTIQDPASQRLTWYKNPLSVLVIKKVRDMSVLPPFIQLVRWLIQVCTPIDNIILPYLCFSCPIIRQ